VTELNYGLPMTARSLQLGVWMAAVYGSAGNNSIRTAQWADNPTRL